MSADKESKLAPLVGFLIVSVALVGYFVGLQSPMNPAAQFEETKALRELGPADIRGHSNDKPHGSDGESSPRTKVIMATHYANMAEATRDRTALWQTHLASLKSNIDPLAEIKIYPGEKASALRAREQNRAFNGAPPTIPHPIDQQSTLACLACHEAGARTPSLRIPRMSHRPLANCTQCHVEGTPAHSTARLFQENTFTGLAAPTEGPRAYAGAPPQIPHTTLMRSDCMSCHGLAGLQGLRTTHPWRKNCTQCHTPSADMDQTLLAEEPQFITSPIVEN